MDKEYVILGYVSHPLSYETILTFSAGVIGLYTCYSLIEKGVAAKNIEIVAQHLPGDTSKLYTSPWAGGNFSCISPDDVGTLKYDKFTYTNLGKLFKKLGPNCGLAKLPTTEMWDFEPSQAKIDSISGYLENFTIIPEKDLKGKKFGVKYTTWNFNCPKFIQHFHQYLLLLGVTFTRKSLTSLSEATSSSTIVLFNCSGIGAYYLTKDEKVFPVRGQVLVIDAPHIKENRMIWGTDSATYIIPRPDSTEVVLGGFVQSGNWSGDTLKTETEDIVQRTTALFPETANMRVLRVATGLRPYREGGVRIEKQTIGSVVIIHNYGAGGYGYQAGLGMADHATALHLDQAKL